MNTLYLREQGSKLGCHGRRLVVTKNEQQLFDAPVHRFERIVLVGHIQITSHAVALLLDNRVPLIQTTTTGRLRGILNPPESHHVELRKKQYRLTDDADFSDSFCRHLVSAKSQNMIEVLRRYAYNHQTDKTILEHVLRIKDYSARLGSIHGTEAIRGIEGIISREYFAAIAQILTRRGIAFHGRNRRPPADPFNAVLSYCYTLLTNYCICAVQTSGLDVFLGFMHSAHHGGAALAFDFVEQFRQPIVDRFVLSSFLRKELIPNSFQPGPNGAIYLREEPKKELIIAWEKHFETPRRYFIKKDKICARELINEYAERLERSIKEEKPLEHFTIQVR